MMYKRIQGAVRTIEVLRRACTRLRRYETHYRAVASFDFSRWGTYNGAIFPCPECGGYHIRAANEKALLASQVNITFG